MAWAIGSINGQTVTHTDPGDIHVQGKIDGASTVTLVSTGGSIIIDGKIDGASIVRLQAANNVQIGAVGLPDDTKIERSWVTVVAEQGSITLGSKIDFSVGSPMTEVTFRAATGIDIGDKIDGGSWVKLWTGTGQIHVHGYIGNARVLSWPPGSLVVDGAISGDPGLITSADW